MPERTSNTTRRRVLRGVAASGLLYGGIGVGAADEQETFDEVIGGTADATGDATTEVVYPPEIEEIQAPLAMNPAIHEGNETLRIELDTDLADADPTVTIRPTFGAVRTETELDTETVDIETSDLWLDTHQDVAVLEAELPPVAATPSGQARPLSPGLYDVAVSWSDGEESDVQPRALSLQESFPDEPRIYVVSDSHAGDPRALESGLEESAEEGDPDPFLFRYENVLGVGTDTERWGGFRRAVAEVSALDPDIVIFPGDLAFGQDTPKKFYQEYADAYAMLSALRAPVYTALGNHDGYIQGTTDGKQLYRKYIGPWYWSRELREDFRLTSIDTYDWAETDRLGASYGVSAWGGQVRDEQRERLRDVIEPWRGANPDGTHVSFSHHSPAWRQDDTEALAEETDGIPVGEQVSRGVTDIATGGQSWRGAGRIETRRLLEDIDTDLHIDGHKHRDRLSRDLGGEIVYTPDGDAALRRYDHDEGTDLTDEFSQTDLKRDLLDDDGPLYVNVTTAGSGTSQYWGWRTFEVGSGHINPSEFGYQPADPGAFLEERAVNGESWPTEHAELGRYSHPTFEFDLERFDIAGDGVGIRVHNDLETQQSGTLLLSVPFETRPDVDGGDLLWRRVGDGQQDLTVAYDAAPEDEHEIRLSRR